MAITVTVLGPVNQGGGTLIKCLTEPNVRVKWTLTKNSGPGTGGSITAVQDYADTNGAALAIWSSTGALSGDSITITAESHL